MAVVLIVAIQVSGALVGSDQDVQVAVAIEIAKRRSAPDLRVRKAATQGARLVLGFQL